MVSGFAREKPPRRLEPFKKSVPRGVVAFTQTTTHMPASATDAIVDGHPSREDDASPLERFVRHVSTVHLYLNVVGASQINSRKALRNCETTRRRGYLGTPVLNSLGVAGVNLTLCHRLTAAIVSALHEHEETRTARLVFLWVP